MTIIGIHGLAGAGKDTVADYLVEQYDFEKIAFAQPIKDAAQIIFGLYPEVFIDRELKERVIPWLGKSPRQIAQLIGTEFGRQHFGDDIWIKVAKQRIDAWREEVVDQTFHPLCGIVITDVRFENEAAFVRAEGGVVWHIHRPGVDPVSSHVSENGIAVADRDLVIHNDGLKFELFDKVDALIRDRLK